MDRRKYLKTLAVSSVGAVTLLKSCDTPPKQETANAEQTFTIDRTPAELAREKQLQSEKFFDDHE
jgi:gluconate 2-dehydrogenase gamma chain